MPEKEAAATPAPATAKPAEKRGGKKPAKGSKKGTGRDFLIVDRDLRPQEYMGQNY